MSPMKPIPADQPLTEAELDELETSLKKMQEKVPEVMGLEELDGFFAALIAGPEVVLPSEYMPEVFGEDGMEAFDSNEEAEKVLTLMMRHWNFIADTLAKDESHLPVFTEWEGEIPLGNDWAKGFMRGTHFCNNAWVSLMNNEERGGCLLPMMILVHEHDPDPELRPGPISPEKRQNIVAHMAAGLARAYQYFKEQRKEDAALLAESLDDSDDFGDEIPNPVIRSEPKIGRNDPCPCGSGKKYKRCHGGVTVQ